MPIDDTTAPPAADGRLVGTPPAVSFNSRGAGGTIFDVGRNCRAVVRADRLALLVDAADYFKAFAEAAEHARHSIMVLAWDFNSSTRLRWSDFDIGAPPILGDFLNFLVRRRRGLHVYILNWDYPMVFGTDREFPPIYGLGRWRPRRRVHFEYDNTHPVGGSHHQKVVVIDDAIAFSGGLDLTCRRWDTCEHRACDPRRVFNEVAYPPFHDVMVAVDRDAARMLGALARERWLRATGEVISAPAPPRSDPWPRGLRVTVPSVQVGISCTFPSNGKHEEAREVEALYLDMIARARRHLYIENQYFTSDSIGAALAARLAEPDGPEVVVVSRLLSHGWLEEHTMHVLRAQLVRRLQTADRWRRFNIYYPHVPDLQQGTCIDVHSKLVVLDDEWLRVGSANLSNRSMGLDTECDVTLEARGDARVSAAIRDIRNRLLGEHLDVAPERVQVEIERAGSLHGAIEMLHNDGRTLRPLSALPEWPDTIVNIAQVADLESPVSLDQLIDEFAPDTGTVRAGPAGSLWAAALVIAGLALVWRYTPLADAVSAEHVGEWAMRFADVPWAPFVVALAYTPASILMFPRPLITLFAVVAFGPWLGFTYAMCGILLAACVPYFAGRTLDRSTVRRLAGHNLNRISEVLRRRGLVAVTALRLVPIAPFAVGSLVAGAIRIRVWQLLLGTFIGMLPGALAATIFGEQLQAALVDPAGINYWVLGGVAAAFLSGVLIVRRWFKRQIARRGGRTV